MKVISKDFEMLTELSFPRIAINENESYGLHIFCDSSTEAYGFVIYDARYSVYNVNLK